MEVDKKTARIVGVLFIIGTAAGVLSLVTAGFTVHSPDYLVKLSENKNRILLGVLLELTMGISLAMIPVTLFPIFRKKNEALALGAVVFRGALELVAYMGIALCWLLLLSVSQKYVNAGITEASTLQLIGIMLLEAEGKCAYMLDIVFSIGALFIYFLFYKTKIIPMWLSIWGFIGGLLYMAYPIVLMFGPDIGLLQGPLAIQEMIMAGWLIIKGFDPSALDELD